jgi:glutamate-1-semialdehyde 2,1-aminomutase
MQQSNFLISPPRSLRLCGSFGFNERSDEMCAVQARERTAELVRRAARVLPGASLGSFQLPLDETVVIAEGRGSRLWDVDGNEYIDYVLGSGPMLIGHAHPAVVEAVQRQAAKGSTFYSLNEPIIALSEAIVDAVPCAEAIKYISTGTEATFHALRIARAATGKQHILKFEGGFHGVHDYALVSAFGMDATGERRRVVDSAGIPQAASGTVIVAPYNDPETVREVIAAHAETLAAVIMEPMQRAITPVPGFLEAVREATKEYGVLLIFDEVVTGFRLAYGGAQEYFGVVPDLATYAKAIGGGYPLAAVAGRRDLIALTDPQQRANGPHAVLGGTLSGNPVAASAGLATLAELKKPGTHERLFASGNRLREGIAALGRDLGIPLQVPGVGAVFQVFFTDQSIHRHEDTLGADSTLAYRFAMELLHRGIYHAPNTKFYISTAHTDADVDQTLVAIEEALRAMRE